MKKPMYRVNDFVLIDKLFSTAENFQGEMKKIEKPLIARVVDVNYTSLGPNYKLKLLTESDISLKIRYWETDILCAFEI